MEEIIAGPSITQKYIQTGWMDGSDQKGEGLTPHLLMRIDYIIEY
jgi:hypothetical protein